jgi:hypothetical protein
MTRKTSAGLIIGLVVAVLAGIVYFQVLHQRVLGWGESAASEEQAREEVVAPPIITQTDALTAAQFFWISPSDADKLEAVTLHLPLSADPELRSRQLIRELISSAPSPQQAPLPADTELLAFYMLPDGTGVADFSDSLASETPSGILSEEMAVDSIVRTLSANVQSLRRLKILIHGQAAETLAGHVDLTGFFEVPPQYPTAASH